MQAWQHRLVRRVVVVIVVSAERELNMHVTGRAGDKFEAGLGLRQAREQ
jgi:hypothetical protein